MGGNGVEKIKVQEFLDSVFFSTFPPHALDSVFFQSTEIGKSSLSHFLKIFRARVLDIY